MVAPTKEQFSLNKIKLVKDGGLDIVYTVRVTCGSENYYENYHFVSPRICHPDLLSKVESLKPMMLRVLHLSFFRSLMETPDFKATKKQKELAESAYKEVADRLTISGFALSGKDKTRGVIITSLFKADTKQTMAINSHRIRFYVTTYGFEEDIEAIVDALHDEVHAYIWEGKSAQLELFSANGDDDSEDINEKIDPDDIPFSDEEDGNDSD